MGKLPSQDGSEEPREEIFKEEPTDGSGDGGEVLRPEDDGGDATPIRPGGALRISEPAEPTPIFIPKEPPPPPPEEPLPPREEEPPKTEEPPPTTKEPLPPPPAEETPLPPREQEPLPPKEEEPLPPKEEGPLPPKEEEPPTEGDELGLPPKTEETPSTGAEADGAVSIPTQTGAGSTPPPGQTGAGAPEPPPPVVPAGAPLATERMLQLLPGIYQEDAFVRDFLRAFEKILLGRADGPNIGRGLEESIAGLADYFDPQKAPKEFLPWLADWTALSLRADLSDQQQREFLANVIQLYRYRGTKENLRRLLAIFTGGLPQITEYPNRPHYFYAVVSLSPDVQGKPAVIARLKEIAYALTDLEKPAHTDYDLDFDFPSMQVKVHSTVGVDTILGTVR